jgi:hypothetical protein
MGSSYIDYRGRGFRTGDGYAQVVWLYLLCLEIDAMTDAPDWLKKVDHPGIKKGKTGSGTVFGQADRDHKCWLFVVVWGPLARVKRGVDPKPERTSP